MRSVSPDAGACREESLRGVETIVNHPTDALQHAAWPSDEPHPDLAFAGDEVTWRCGQRADGDSRRMPAHRTLLPPNLATAEVSPHDTVLSCTLICRDRQVGMIWKA